MDENMHLSLIFDLEQILDYPNKDIYAHKEKIQNTFGRSVKNRGFERESFKVMKKGRKVCYPGKAQQRRAIRTNFWKFMNYLNFPRELRNEKNKIYKIIRSMFIYQYIARKDNILAGIERDRILKEIHKNKINIEKYKIAIEYQYNLINQITSALYDEKKDIYDENIENKYRVNQLKDLLNTNTNITYLKKIESLIRD